MQGRRRTGPAQGCVQAVSSRASLLVGVLGRRSLCLGFMAALFLVALLLARGALFDVARPFEGGGGRCWVIRRCERALAGFAFAAWRRGAWRRVAAPKPGVIGIDQAGVLGHKSLGRGEEDVPAARARVDEFGIVAALT